MRKRRLLPIVLVLLLTVLLALVLRDIARDLFLVELRRAYRDARFLFESLPQIVIWGLLLVALFVVAVKSLYRRRRPLEKVNEEDVQSRGRVLALTRWIQRTSKGDYFTWSLARYLGDLACEAMAYQERATPEQLKRRLRAGRLDLPPTGSAEIRDYLEFGRNPLFATPAGFFSRIRARLGTGARPPSFDPALEDVVEFLEEQLKEAGGST